MVDRRIFAVGDVHGCRDKLRVMMKKIDWRPDNHEELIFLGDYIDRGPDSFEVVEMVMGIKARHPKMVTLLKGNHEDTFLKFAGGEESLVLTANGVSATIRSYVRNGAFGDAFPTSHLDFYENLELYHVTEEHIFVHAGLKPGVALESQNERDILWIREGFIDSDFDFGKTVVFGHTPYEAPFICPGRAGLDTGAVFGGPLTCLEISQGRLICV